MIWQELVAAERRGDATVVVASLRCWCESVSGPIHSRTWAKHKRLACVSRRQKVSEFRALLLWLSVARGAKGDPAELIEYARQFCQRYPGKVEAFVASTACRGFGPNDLAAGVQCLVPDLPPIKWRSTLAGWCERAGLAFSVRSNYGPSDVVAIASVAAQGRGRGRNRRNGGGDFFCSANYPTG